MTFHSVPEAADRLDLCPSLLRRYCRQGRLGTRVGGRWIISEDELVRFESEPRPMGRPRSLVVAAPVIVDAGDKPGREPEAE